jgi:hypothetical protein
MIRAFNNEDKAVGRSQLSQGLEWQRPKEIDSLNIKELMKHGNPKDSVDGRPSGYTHLVLLEEIRAI